MIESEKIDEYYIRVMYIINEMRNHGDIIFNQQVVKKILINVMEKYKHIVAITEETKDVSKLSIKKSSLAHFIHIRKRKCFCKDHSKETVFQVQN